VGSKRSLIALEIGWAKLRTFYFNLRLLIIFDAIRGFILKVDERAVLKHFDWPERKADALREASFEYRDLKKLQDEVSAFEDKRELPCDAALQKILKCLEK